MTIDIDNERLTKKQTAALLGIGYSTLGKWMREGKIKFHKVEAGRFESSVFFNRADLAEFLPSVTEPVTQPTAPSMPDSGILPTAPSAKLAERPESKDLRTWAEKFRDGDAPDSCGNYRDGANNQFPETGATLLGPVTRDDPAPVSKSGCDHMDPRLLGDYQDPETRPLITTALYENAEDRTESGSPLCRGYSAEQYKHDMAKWRKAGGGRSMAEQELQVRRAQQNISRSFPKP